MCGICMCVALYYHMKKEQQTEEQASLAAKIVKVRV